MNKIRYKISEISGLYVVQFERTKVDYEGIFLTKKKEYTYWELWGPVFFPDLDSARKFVKNRQQNPDANFKEIEIHE